MEEWPPFLSPLTPFLHPQGLGRPSTTFFNSLLRQIFSRLLSNCSRYILIFFISITLILCVSQIRYQLELLDMQGKN
jgi:hypothetical protein